MTVKTKNKVLSDLLANEVNPAYTREAGTLRNSSGGAVVLTNPLGYPCKLSGGKYHLAIAGEESEVVALLLATTDFESVANNTDFAPAQPFLLRGPAIIRKSMLPDVDVADDDFDKDAIAVALEGLGIQTQDEPPTTAEQTE